MIDYDVVLTYHTNPFTCGVARFNKLMAAELCVPLVPLTADRRSGAALISVKVSEMLREDLQLLEGDRLPDTYDVFLHDFSGTPEEERLLRGARRVYAGNALLAERMAVVREDVIEAFCPGTTNLEVAEAPELRIFTFGMAHKVRADHYRKLDELLARTGRTYGLYVSTALHEGTSFDDALIEVIEEIRAAFSGPVHFLGYLSDESLAEFLANCEYLAAFFAEGCRANNTSVNAALASGKVVITNLDEWSPSYLRHDETVLDIGRCVDLPDRAGHERLAAGAKAASGDVSWNALLKVLGRRH